MPLRAPIADPSFRRILTRNIAFPLAASAVSAAVFLALIVYLINVMNWVEHSERVIGNANEITKQMVDMETGMRGYLLAGEEAFLEPYIFSKPKVKIGFKTLADLVADNPSQVEQLHRIQEQQLQWDSYASEMIKLRSKGEEVFGAAITGRGKTQFDEIRRLVDAFTSVEIRLRQERNAMAKRVTMWVAGIYLLLTLGVGSLLAFIGRREIVQLAESYENTLLRQNESNAKLKEQAWMQNGHSELAEKIIGQLSLSALSSTLLQFVAHYMNIGVGALHICSEDGVLRRSATYGFSRESTLRDLTLQSGEGLIGQVAVDAHILRIDDVPKDYIKVNSSIGDCTPKHLILLPLIHEKIVKGVMEIGFVRKISDRDVDFLKLISGNIGTAIEMTNTRLRLQNSFEEMQQMNEELQAQQEELRAANEELSAQARALEFSQESLQNQKSELLATNAQLHSQAEVLDQKNEALKVGQFELERRAKQLDQASQYKSQFLANMSHELRTPLNSALILSKLLSNNSTGNLSDEEVSYAETIYSAGNDLLQLINDVLDIAKVEAGKLELVQETFPLAHVMEGLKMMFEPQAEKKGLLLSFEVALDAPAALYTDRQRLEQILKNLLSNAIKFTQIGSVSIRVNSSKKSIHFIIADTGIGIKDSEKEVVFEAFKQADGSTSRQYGGTGLGLSISRDLAQLLGGAITLYSTPGSGSTFTLSLPINGTTPEAPDAITSNVEVPDRVVSMVPEIKAESPAPLQVIDAHNVYPQLEISPKLAFDDDRYSIEGRFVLVIEDDPAFAKILYELAHEMAYQCIVALDASDGLAFAKEFLPIAILLDVSLPDRSGLLVLNSLKSIADTRHIPVHIISGTDHVSAALHMGAVGFTRKPMSREELMAVFSNLEQKSNQKFKRVLLVEDDIRQRESLIKLISEKNIEIVGVELGNEALRQLKTDVFDCMIIDLNLPDMQGLMLLQKMAEESLLSCPPVIVYTGRSLTRDEEIELNKYSRSIIIKGVRSPERLLDEVTLFLHTVERDLSSERQTILRTLRGRDQVFEGRRVLLVDDDVRNIFALSNALEQQGLKVEIARNGVEAIEKLDVVSDIDLVLMDVMMPVMDGLEAMRRIRSDARFKALPIIAITAKAMRDDKEQCLGAGASDYMAKPVELSRLHSLLRVWMPHRGRI